MRVSNDFLLGVFVLNIFLGTQAFPTSVCAEISSQLVALAPSGSVDSIQALTAKAEAGDPKCMFQLGVRYDKGQGVKQDLGKAFMWFQKSAKLGSHAAMFNLGLMYEQGHGTKQDLERALHWYRKSAALGNQLAMSNILSLFLPANFELFGRIRALIAAK